LREIPSGRQYTHYLSCISIAFTSILPLAVLEYGNKTCLEIYILRWINTDTAIIACLVLPHVQLQLQFPGTQIIPTATLLPFIAALISAVCGGIICRFSHVTPQLQVPAIVAYLRVGAGVALATVLDAILIF
jgi:hypothetical protein